MTFARRYNDSPLTAKENGMQIDAMTFVRWEDIKSANLIYLWGSPYILVENGKSLWIDWKIPVFGSHSQRLKADVQKFAPLENPFRQTLLEFDDTPEEYKKAQLHAAKYILTVMFVIGAFLGILLLSISLLKG
jgi:hypothetical protein